jgi:mRNA interferase YafQ
MKYKIKVTNKFQKDLKRIEKRGYNLKHLSDVVKIIASGKALPAKYRDHSLGGNYKNYRECHITPDWLLIYELTEDEMVLYLTRTGTHSDLF